VTDLRTQDPPRTRILAIDDDPATLELVRSVLEANGYACLTAASAEQAFEIIESTAPIPVAISDISMPGMDGILFLERINAQAGAGPVPRVIFLTAHARVDFAVAALRLGAVDFLTKPVRPQELLSAVKTAVERAHRDTMAAQPDRAASLAQQAEALAAALKGWAHIQAQDPQRAASSAPAPSQEGVAASPGDFALLGMDHLRRLRRAFPPLSDLDDTAWDLLLEVLRSEKSGQRLSVSALSISVEPVSSTTALRRIQELAKAGHIVRQPDPTDARRDFVTLAAGSREILESYLERVAKELAAVAAAAR
jgi:CheY-like chemotaxis protein